MDSFYDYIWDVTILEYLTRILLPRRIVCVCVCVCANVHPVTLIHKSKACFDCKFLCDIYLEGTLLEVQTLNM